jgi:hypothetical protein
MSTHRRWHIGALLLRRIGWGFGLVLTAILLLLSWALNHMAVRANDRGESINALAPWSGSIAAAFLLALFVGMVMHDITRLLRTHRMPGGRSHVFRTLNALVCALLLALLLPAVPWWPRADWPALVLAVAAFLLAWGGVLWSLYRAQWFWLAAVAWRQRSRRPPVGPRSRPCWRCLPVCC